MKIPQHYPVFLKPEWGQNSNGIVRVDDDAGFRDFAVTAEKTGMPFIVQEAAKGRREFEIYFLRCPDDYEEYCFLSVTEVKNSCRESHPINSIHNPCTTYIDITEKYSSQELHKIWHYFRDIADFPMARVGLKAKNRFDLLKSVFHVVEINIFLPMPLVLLCENVEWRQKRRIAKTTMSIAARLVKNIPKDATGKKIFFRKMKAHYKIAP